MVMLKKLKSIFIKINRFHFIAFFSSIIVILIAISMNNSKNTTKPSVTITTKETNNSDDQNLVRAFLPLQQSSQFPIIGRNLNNIYSAFGPRVKVSSGGRYDWHKGIDAGDTEGEQIINAYDGVFEGVKKYVDGGTTVIIKHKFSTPLIFKGITLPYFYTFYMHLSKVDPVLDSANLNGQKPQVSAGAKIGLLGSTGKTKKNNLHFEIRVGTKCSLQYQLKNPQSSCTKGYGFDPQVNPLLMFNKIANGFTITQSVSSNQDFYILYTSSNNSLYLNKIEFQLLNKSTNQIIKSHTLDFNTREGFDLSSTSAADTQDKTKPYIKPIIFNSQTSEYKTNIVIPYLFWKTSEETISVITVTDIWGNTKFLNWDN